MRAGRELRQVTEPTDEDRDRLMRLLIGLLAQGRLPSHELTAALRELAPEEALSLGALSDGLAEADGALGVVRQRVELMRKRAAHSAHQLRRRGQELPERVRRDLADLPLDAPQDWSRQVTAMSKVVLAARHLGDQLVQRRGDLGGPGLGRAIGEALEAALAGLAAPISGWGLALPSALAREVAHRAGGPLGALLESLATRLEDERAAVVAAAAAALDAWPAAPLPESLDEGALLEALTERLQRASGERRRALLDLLLCWPSDRAIGAILNGPVGVAEQDRAALMLTLRLGGGMLGNWAARSQWLSEQQAAQRRHLLREQPPELLLLLWLRAASRDDAPTEALAAWAGEHAALPADVTVLARWRDAVEAAPPRAAAPQAPARPARAAPPAPAATDRSPARAAPPSPAVAPPPPAAATPVEERPIWQQHLQGFFAENGYLVAGILMVIASSSLLAFLTWDRHWLLRYTIAPGLLGGVTLVLGWLGSMLEGRDPRLAATGAALRGAAIALLPINFMTIGLLAGDQDVPASWRLAAVFTGGAVYATVFGAALLRWCGAVDARLRRPLGLTLLTLNGLVMLRPLAQLLGLDGAPLRQAVGAGFYVGFAAAAATLIWFIGAVLDRDRVEGERVPAFVVATLPVTFLQVFGWVHIAARELPQAATYAPLVILAGGLLLLFERRLLVLQGRLAAHRAESFLGFALILLGLLLGAGSPPLRIACLLLAGAIWLWQGQARRAAEHTSLAFLMLGGAVLACGLLPSAPPSCWPWLWLACAIAGAAAGWLGRRLALVELTRGAANLEGLSLLMTATVAVTSSWGQAGAPLLPTGLLLIGVSALMTLRARVEDNLRWIHGAAVVVALAQPYLGLAALDQGRLVAGSLVLGFGALSLAWIALAWLAGPTSIAGRTRSSVCCLYGALAVLTMSLANLAPPVEGAAGGWASLTGPLLVALALTVATYTSRSLLPAGMASVLLIVLFPEQKGVLADALGLSAGSGLGGGLCSLGLVAAAFAVRRVAALRDLQGGDLYLDRWPFPMLRRDQTLFGWPLLASAIYLLIKTQVHVAGRYLAGQAIGWEPGVAIALTGLAWTGVAIYLRGQSLAGLVQLGYLSVGAGAALAYGAVAEPLTWAGGALLVLASWQLLYAGWLALAWWRGGDWPRRLLVEPYRELLSWASAAVAVALGVELGAGGEASLVSGLGGPHALAALLGAQLAWLALRERERGVGHGALAWLLLWMVVLDAVADRGAGPLADRLAPSLLALTSISLALVLQVLSLATAHAARALAGLHRPASTGSAIAVGGIGVWACVALVSGPELGLEARALTVGGLLLTAWAHRCGPLLPLAGALAYGMATQADAEHVSRLWQPSHLGPLALLLAVAGAVLRVFERRSERPLLLSGRAPLPWLETPYEPWLSWPAALAALGAAAGQLVDPAWNAAPRELLGPLCGAVALGVIGLQRRQPGALLAAASLLALANIGALRIGWGAALRDRGLTEIQLLAFALGATTVQLSVLRRLLPAAGGALLRHAQLWAVGTLMALLWANLAVHSQMADRWERFAASGVMFALAALFFRAAARERPDDPEAAWFVALQQLGVAMALACVALLWPALRAPETAMAALGLPALVFYLRAELGRGAAVTQREAASIVSFVMLAMYAGHGLAQLVAYPGEPIVTAAYHTSSPWLLLLGVLMLRLHGLGGTVWLAFYAGLALIVGSFFAVCWLPGLSPFEHPLRAAWVALLLGHLWTVALAERSPIRTLVQRLAALDDPALRELQRPVGVVLLLASQVAAGFGLLELPGNERLLTPLLLGAATLWFHHGWRRRAPLYHACGGVIALLALHAGFLLEPSLIAPQQVVWVLLGGWAALLVAQQLAGGELGREHASQAAAGLSLVVGLHGLYHAPWSEVGLVAVALVALLAALTPVRSRRPSTAEELVAPDLLLLAPAWLALFSQLAPPFDVASVRWGTLLALAALLATGALARLFQLQLHAAYARSQHRPRLLDLLLTQLGSAGQTTLDTAARVALVGAAVFHAAVWGEPLADPMWLTLLLIDAGLIAVAVEAARRPEAGPLRQLEAAVSIQLAFGLMLHAARTQGIARLGRWQASYDLWILLGVGLALTAALRRLARSAPSLRVPFAITHALVPLAALLLGHAYDLGSHAALLVLGLHSLMFGTVGEGRRESPYSMAMLVCAVAFVLVGFWTQLQLRVAHAYVIPVSLGVLGLLWMLGDRVDRPVRRAVQRLALLAMLLSTSFYVIADDRYPLAFNLTLLLLSLAMMASGTALRRRSYLLLGFCGILINLGSITVKTLMRVDQTARMSAIGAIVLVAGAALIAGAVYVKTHRARVDELIARWHAYFDEPES